MNKQQRDRSLNLALRMHEVKIQLTKLLLGLNLRRELRQSIQIRLGFAPVKGVLPMLCERFDFIEWCSLGPACIFRFVWEAGEGEFLLQKLDVGVGDGDSEGLYGRHDGEERLVDVLMGLGGLIGQVMVLITFRCFSRCL